MEGDVKHTQSTVLFADISDSTKLYQLLGDADARQLVMDCLNLVGGIVENGKGRIIDRIGDELMCAFEQPAAAIRAATQIQKEVYDAGMDGKWSARINLRIGLHHGAVVQDGQSIFGDAVYTANRMVSLAKGQQILLTKETVDQLNPQSGVLTRFVDRTRIKGKKERIEIHEVVWNPQDMTVVIAPNPETTIGKIKLELKTPTDTYLIDADRPMLTIGRSKDCDVVVNDIEVSRLHALIEYNKGQFKLVDRSTNGTRILKADGREQLLRRDEMPLPADGTILLGRKSDQARGRILKFRCLAWSS